MADTDENEYGEPIAPQGPPPGSAVDSPGPMESGPDAGAGGGTPKKATTGIGTESGPKAGAGEIVN